MKITTETVARLAGLTRKHTRGAYGVAHTPRPGHAPKVTDLLASRVWEGPDAARQAAGFYAGILDQLRVTTGTDLTWLRRVLAEVNRRHGDYIADGRIAARTWQARQQGTTSARKTG